MARKIKRCFLLYFATFVLAFLVMSAAWPATSSLDPQLIQIWQLSQVNLDQAVSAIADLEQHLPNDLSKEDQRAFQILRMDIVWHKNDDKKTQKLIDELKQFSLLHHDETARLWALVYQAYLLQGQDSKYAETLLLLEPALNTINTSNDGLLKNYIEDEAAYLNVQIGNFQVALEHYLRALEALDSLPEGEWRVEFARAGEWSEIGNFYNTFNDPETAQRYFKKAKVLAHKLNATRLLSVIINEEGKSYEKEGKIDLARTAYKAALVLARKTRYSYQEVLSLNSLSSVSWEAKNYADCADYAQQALNIVNPVNMGDVKEEPQIALGVCHMYLGDMQKGIAEAERGLNLIRQANAKPDIVTYSTLIADAYLSSSMYKEALPLLNESYQIANEIFDADRDRATTEMGAYFEAKKDKNTLSKLMEQTSRQQKQIETHDQIQTVIRGLLGLLGFAGIVILFLFVRALRQNLILRAIQRKLAHDATRDPLTGLLNRRAFDNIIASFDLENDRRYTSNSGIHDVLILLDIDHFKRINDTYGHPTGDSVLIEMGKRLQKILRRKDMLIRWGGEEFLIYLHQISTTDIVDIVERTLFVVGSTPFSQDDPTKEAVAVTISAGFMLLPLPGGETSKLSWERALKLIDLALYRAKKGGRNQAIGLEKVTGTKEQVDALYAGDLNGSVDSEVVSLRCIKGK